MKHKNKPEIRFVRVLSGCVGGPGIKLTPGQVIEANHKIEQASIEYLVALKFAEPISEEEAKGGSEVSEPDSEEKAKKSGKPSQK